MGGAKQVLYQNKLRACADTSVLLQEKLGEESREKKANGKDKLEFTLELTTETQPECQVGKCHRT